jgi:hypothetical protein
MISHFRNRASVLCWIVIILLTSCVQSNDLNINDYVDHWEISRTFETHNNSTLDIDMVENEFKVVTGNNQILIVTVEKSPVFKEGKELTDLYSTKSLLIELDQKDSFVTAETPSNSRFFRKLVAFSPDYGINPLYQNEKISLKRNGISVWVIDSDIEDFIFSGQLDFGSNQILIDRYNDY